MYDFNKRKLFKIGYIAGNNRLNQEYKRYNERNIGQKGSLLTKSK